MTKFLSTLAEQDFKPPSVELSGKMIRFNRTSAKSAWFIGWQHYLTKTGEPYIVAVYGDWATDERYEYKSGLPTTKEDRDIIERKLKIAREQAEKIRAERQLQVAEEAQGLWSTLI